jgi:hypothetical protein
MIRRMRTRWLLGSLAALAALGCSPTVHHARLDDGAGLTEGAPVMVARVRVGRVESVRVVDTSVDVGFVLEGDHQVTLRADTCAMAATDGAPALVIVPGEAAPLAEERAIPQCRLETDALDQVMRSFGQGLDAVMRSIQQQASGQGGAPPTPGQPQPPGAAPTPSSPPGAAPPMQPLPPPFSPTFPTAPPPATAPPPGP